MLKVLQARLQQYMNWELPDVQAGFRKGRGTRDQIANIHWIIEKARMFQKKHLLLLYWYSKAFDVWITTNWKIPQKIGIPDHLTCLLRNLCAGQVPPEKSVCRSRSNRTGHGTMNWFQIGKGLCQGCILLPCLFNIYAECIMKNAGLDEAQLESRLPGEISVTSDMQMTPPLWQKAKRN